MKLKYYIILIGIGVLLWNLFFVTKVFILAYLPSYGSYRYVMKMNYYGEGFFEIILVIALFPFGLYAGYVFLKDILVKKVKET